ncbi:MAG: proton-conducting transporter membrane subunit [Maricaulaceae bacterium]
MILPVSPEALLLAALIIPLLGGAGVLAFANIPDLREASSLTAAVALFVVVLSLVGDVAAGGRPELVLFAIAPGLDIALRLEPLGALFAAIASGLWILNSIYSIGYMRGNAESDQTRFYLCFTIAIASAMGVALSANLLTLFVFYEVLTLSTYPLVAHKGTETARKGAKVYALLLLSTSLILFLPAILITYAVAGTTSFILGGVLAGAAGSGTAALLLALYAFGLGKAALIPVHGWLPNAMVAPTPVSALLHAVAVVKAGVFSLLKVVLYTIGPVMTAQAAQATGLIWVAAFTILAASLVAMTKDNLKARLAYSTVSQLAYVSLGAFIATPAALAGAALQILMHAFGKITLFMTAGAIYVGAKKTEVSTLDGLGRVMPWVFGAYFIGALSIIGVPPLGGSWPKFLLMTGAADAELWFLLGGLAVSSVLNVVYLVPIALRGFYGPGPRYAPGSSPRAPALTVLPPVLTALAAVALVFVVEPVAQFLSPVTGFGG